MWISGLNGKVMPFYEIINICYDICPRDLTFKSGCRRKPGKMLKTSTEGGQQNKFTITS